MAADLFECSDSNSTNPMYLPAPLDRSLDPIVKVRESAAGAEKMISWSETGL